MTTQRRVAPVSDETNDDRAGGGLGRAGSRDDDAEADGRDGDSSQSGKSQLHTDVSLLDVEN